MKCPPRFDTFKKKKKQICIVTSATSTHALIKKIGIEAYQIISRIPITRSTLGCPNFSKLWQIELREVHAGQQFFDGTTSCA